MIIVNNLEKYYGTFKALDEISFEIKKEGILGFLGPNGAGKTTTMKILTCFMLPDGGRILIDGLDVEEHSIEIRKKIGYLPENNPLYLDMSIIDYLKFISNIRNIEKNKINQRIKEIIYICGLSEMLNKNIGELSKGYRQRVGLAQALIHDPKILILDEPTNGLDPNQIVEIRNLIKEIGKEKMVILSTHILPEVEMTCERVLIINKGKIVADGTTEEIQKSFQGRQELILEILSDSQKELIESKILSIKNISGISLKKCEKEKYLYNIEVENEEDIREKLFDLAVENKWKILTLNKIDKSLENIFRNLTVSEESEKINIDQ